MILNRQKMVRVARPPLEDFLARVQRELGLRQADITICLVSDAEIARMNQAFRKKMGPTDVLSFPSTARNPRVRPPHGSAGRRASRSQEGKFLGDIAISPMIARRNAKQFGRSLPEELQVLILHGVLHLLGYDHERDRGQMERLEARLRHRLGLGE